MFNAKSIADEIVFEGFIYGGDVAELIFHLRDVHEMSFEEMKIGIEHIRKVVGEPANDPFEGWEKLYYLAP